MLNIEDFRLPKRSKYLNIKIELILSGIQNEETVLNLRPKYKVEKMSKSEIHNMMMKELDYASSLRTELEKDFRDTVEYQIGMIAFLEKLMKKM